MTCAVLCILKRIRLLFFCPEGRRNYQMLNRNHDPTDFGMPECSTTGTLRETLERLKGEEYFRIKVRIGGETDGNETIQSG